MTLLRKDYLTDNWVFYATDRRKRPMEFKKSQSIKRGAVDFFAPGNEHLTPPEIGRVEYKGSWKMRWFANKFPAVSSKVSGSGKKSKYFVQAPAFGYHEIIAETPSKTKQLAQLPVEDYETLFEIYSTRIAALEKKKGIKYVVVFKNNGPDAGTSLVHSHSQIVAINMVPNHISEDMKMHTKKKSPFTPILKKEATGPRRIFNSKNVLAFCPYASVFNFEAWIFPKRYVGRLSQMNAAEIKDMAKALKQILAKLRSLNASYNYYLHYAPIGKNLHFHIKVKPRFSTWGGFEFSTGAVINSVLPEEAAKFYRSR